MEIILSLILGAICGAGGLWCWQRTRPNPGVTIMGGGGPGEEQTPP